LFDRNYLEHLNLRLPQDGYIPPSLVQSRGFSAYFGVELTAPFWGTADRSTASHQGM
jgi:hypothetical protein